MTFNLIQFNFNSIKQWLPVLFIITAIHRWAKVKHECAVAIHDYSLKKKKATQSFF